MSHVGRGGGARQRVRGAGLVVVAACAAALSLARPAGDMAFARAVLRERAAPCDASVR